MKVIVPADSSTVTSLIVSDGVPSSSIIVVVTGVVSTLRFSKLPPVNVPVRATL